MNELQQATEQAAENTRTYSTYRPKDITIEREAGVMKLTWIDGRISAFPLRWLRANCPCATCREERRKAASDPLHLSVGPEPSTVINGGEIVGNYAIRLEWADEHATGIYAFSALYGAYFHPDSDPDNLPPLITD